MIESSFALDASCNTVAFALCSDGQLYMRHMDICGVTAEGSAPEVRSYEWTPVAQIGCEHKGIAVDCGYIYGLNADMGVDVQTLSGASSDRWTNLARGYTVSIAVQGGTVFGLGTAAGGDRVYRLTQTATARWGRPWQCTSKGRSRSIAIEGGHVYTLGVNDYVYRQPIDGMSETSKWEKAFHVPSGVSGSCSSGDCKVFNGENSEMQPSSVSFAVFGGGCAPLAVFDGCVWRLVCSGGDRVGWEREPAAGLPLGSVAITAAPSAEMPTSGLRKGAALAYNVALECQNSGSKASALDEAKISRGVYGIIKDLPKELLENPEVAQKIAQAEALLREVFTEARNRELQSSPEVASPAPVLITETGPEPPDQATDKMDREAAEPHVEDLAKLSVKELKHRIAGAGVALPVGLTEKAELVAMLHATRCEKAAQNSEQVCVSAVPEEPAAAVAADAADRAVESGDKAALIQPLVIGAIAQVMHAVDPVDMSGYLALSKGTHIKLLHVGKEDNASESGWVYAEVVGTGEIGWLRASNLRPEDAAIACPAIRGASSELTGVQKSVVKVASTIGGGTQGYLSLCPGDEVFVEYVGCAEYGDEGWLFGCRAGSTGGQGECGWFPATSLEHMPTAVRGSLPVPAA